MLMKLEDYNEYYIQGSDHYLIPKAAFIELYEEMNNFRKESRENKEVIDKAIKELEKGINFCKNDSQEVFGVCNMAILREQSILDILKEVE